MGMRIKQNQQCHDLSCWFHCFWYINNYSLNKGFFGQKPFWELPELNRFCSNKTLCLFGHCTSSAAFKRLNYRDFNQCFFFFQIRSPVYSGLRQSIKHQCPKFVLTSPLPLSKSPHITVMAVSPQPLIWKRKCQNFFRNTRKFLLKFHWPELTTYT